MQNVRFQCSVNNYLLTFYNQYTIFGVQNKQIMDNEAPARKNLEAIAAKGGVRIAEIYTLVNQVYIDDANYQKKVNAMRQEEITYYQLQLMKLQTTNEIVKEKLLVYELDKKLKKQSKFKLFHHGSKKGSPETGKDPAAGEV